MALLQPPLLFYNAVVVAWVNGFAYILWVFLLHPWFRAASESIILFTTLLGATATGVYPPQPPCVCVCGGCLCAFAPGRLPWVNAVSGAFSCRLSCSLIHAVSSA